MTKKQKLNNCPTFRWWLFLRKINQFWGQLKNGPDAENYHSIHFQLIYHWTHHQKLLVVLMTSCDHSHLSVGRFHTSWYDCNNTYFGALFCSELYRNQSKHIKCWCPCHYVYYFLLWIFKVVRIVFDTKLYLINVHNYE